MNAYRIQINKKTKYAINASANHSCAIQVSVGSKAYEGVKLQALLMWSEKRYQSIVLLVNDLPRRHNSTSLDNSAADRAEHLGREWISRNWRAIELLPNKKVIASSSWLSNHLFSEIKNDVCDYIKNNPKVRRTINHDALQYINRNNIRITPNSIIRGKRFIVEELVIMELQGRLFDWDYIHAGGQLETLKVLTEMNDSVLTLTKRRGFYVTHRRLA